MNYWNRVYMHVLGNKPHSGRRVRERASLGDEQYHPQDSLIDTYCQQICMT